MPHPSYVRSTRKLHAAKRWYRIREEFGCGLLSLIPVHFQTYIEHKLTDSQLELWMRLIVYCHPNARAFAKTCEERLMLYIGGVNPLPARPLVLEVISATDLRARTDIAALLDLVSDEETSRLSDNEGRPLSSYSGFNGSGPVGFDMAAAVQIWNQIQGGTDADNTQLTLEGEAGQGQYNLGYRGDGAMAGHAGTTSTGFSLGFAAWDSNMATGPS